MPYFAKIQPTGVADKFTVEDVIRIDQATLDTGAWGDPATYMQTDYNTYGNVHYAPSPPAEPQTPDGGIPIRANYAGIGYTFDSSYTVGDYVGVFYAPQPYPSWILNTDTFLWEAPNPPGPAPSTGGPYIWDENTLSWVSIAPTP
jgi:hypothetical protein